MTGFLKPARAAGEADSTAEDRAAVGAQTV